MAACTQEAPLPLAPVPSVIVAPVVRADGARGLHLSGSLSAERSIALSFTAIGTVEQVNVQSVGATFFRLDVHGMPGSTNALVFGQVSVPISGVWEGRHNTASQSQRISIARSKLASTRELLELGIEKSWADFQTADSSCRYFGVLPLSRADRPPAAWNVPLPDSPCPSGQEE